MHHAAFRELLVEIIMRPRVRGNTSLIFPVFYCGFASCLQIVFSDNELYDDRATKVFYSNFRTVVCFSTKIKALKNFSR